LKTNGFKKLARRPKKDPSQKLRAKKTPQNVAFEKRGSWLGSGHHGPTVVTTTSNGGCHGRGGPKLPWVLRFLRGFSFFHAVMVCLGHEFVFKGDVSGCKKGEIHHLSFTHTFINSIRGAL